MPDAKPPPARNSREEVIRTSIVIGLGVALLNATFFVLSYAYFKAHAVNLGIGTGLDYYEIDKVGLANAREAFLVLSLIVGAVTFVATRAPREIGHALATLFGLAALAGAYAAFSKSLPTVMGITLTVFGLLTPALVYWSWQKSRAAWAFLIAMVAVFGGVDFFGAPKVRTLLGVGLWTAMILPSLQVITVIALSSLRRDYRAAA